MFIEEGSLGGKVMAYGSGRPSSSQLEGAVGEVHRTLESEVGICREESMGEAGALVDLNA